MTNTYPRTVQAAARLGADKKELAEALLTEIPPRNSGRTKAGTETINECLAEAAQRIYDETGEKYAPETLDEYRKIAVWASTETEGIPSVSWADASWTAHYEAFKRREKFEDFKANPGTKRQGRSRAGRPTGDAKTAARAIEANPAEADALVAALGNEGKAALAHAMVQDPDAYIEVLQAVDEKIGNRRPTTPKTGGKATAFDVIAFVALEVKLDKLVTKFSKLRGEGYRVTPEALAVVMDTVTAMRGKLQSIEDVVTGAVNTTLTDEDVAALLGSQR